MNISLWTIFFLALSAQGVFLGLILLTRKRMIRGNRRYLGVFVIVFSIILFFWVCFWNGLENKYVHFNFLYNPIPFLVGPFLFFYIKSFFKRIKTLDLLHFTPFLLALFYFIPFYILNKEQKIEVLQNDNLDSLFWQFNYLKNIWSYLQLLIFIYYSALIYRYINKSKFSRNSIEEIYVKKWLNLLLILFSLFTLLSIFSFLAMEFYQLTLTADYIAGAFIGILIYIIGYIGLNHDKYVKSLETIFTKKYKRSALTEKDAPFMIEKIIQYIESYKPFLNSSFKLGDLAIEVNISSHHISELLNSYHDKNFAELINYYRIEEAKRLLISNDYDNKKVSVIGYDVGFNSRTAFYQWFKKLTGESPSIYQKKFKQTTF